MHGKIRINIWKSVDKSILNFVTEDNYQYPILIKQILYIAIFINRKHFLFSIMVMR